MTPSLASIDTVKLVPNLELLCPSSIIIFSPRLSTCSGDNAKHTNPLASFVIILIDSGVTLLAAWTKSPSFSLSSSSTTIIIFPLLISEIAFSIDEKGEWESFDCSPELF